MFSWSVCTYIISISVPVTRFRPYLGKGFIINLFAVSLSQIHANSISPSTIEFISLAPSSRAHTQNTSIFYTYNI